MSATTLGERVATRRKELKLTQAQYADKVGITRQLLSMIEKNHRFPAWDVIDLIANEMGVSAYKLATGNDDKNATVARDLGLSNDTINTLKSANDQRIQKAIDIMVNDKDILVFLYHFFTDPDTVYKSSAVYIKAKNGKLIHDPIYTSSDMERLNRLKLLDDLQSIRDKNKGGAENETGKR